MAVPASLALIAISGAPTGQVRREIDPSPAKLASILLGTLLVVAIIADWREAK